jgi:hypothetical protein
MVVDGGWNGKDEVFIVVHSFLNWVRELEILIGVEFGNSGG